MNEWARGRMWSDFEYRSHSCISTFGSGLMPCGNPSVETYAKVRMTTSGNSFLIFLAISFTNSSCSPASPPSQLPPGLRLYFETTFRHSGHLQRYPPELSISEKS